MAKPFITGLIVRAGSAEWTTLRPSKVQDAVSAGKVEFDPLPPAGSADAPGDGRDAALEAAAGRIRVGCKDAEGPVTLAIASENVLLRALRLPTTDDAEIAGMARLQADKFSPFPIEQMVVSHEVLHKAEDHALVLVAAARQTLIDEAGELLKGAGIVPVRVDAQALGWWRLLRDAGEIREKGRHVVLIVADNRAEAIVFEGGVPIFFRSLGEVSDVAADTVAADLAQELGYTLMSLDLEHGVASERAITVWRHAEARGILEERLAGACSCGASAPAFP